MIKIIKQGKCVNLGSAFKCACQNTQRPFEFHFHDPNNIPADHNDNRRFIERTCHDGY